VHFSKLRLLSYKYKKLYRAATLSKLSKCSRRRALVTMWHFEELYSEIYSNAVESWVGAKAET